MQHTGSSSSIDPKPKKVGTLKDISLFGSFIFPTEGQFVNGLQMRPLAGIGNSYARRRRKFVS